MRHVALLIETSRSYGRHLYQGIHRYVTEQGPWSMFMELRALDSRPPAWLRSWRGDGILSRTGSPQMAQALARVSVPVVELRATRFTNPFPFVGVDNEAVGRMIAEHLLERGFRNFGVYELNIEDYFAERCDTFVQVIRQAGFPVDTYRAKRPTERPQEWERHQDKLVKWLQGLPKPVGLMASTDQVGYWLLDACARAGIVVPEQAAVVGAENEETLCMMASPPLSSVAYNASRIGYVAAKLLDSLMQGEAPPDGPVLIPPLHIVMRQSSDVVAIDDPQVARAVQFIRENACDGITVHDVVRAADMSRSSLERRIRSLLGRSPHDEILRVRLEQARQLLARTDLSLEAVAQRCGFQTPQYFSTAFRRESQLTPGAYRKQTQR